MNTKNNALSTPSAAWRQAGEPDPHAGYYDCERAKLAMGHLTDYELANGAFMNYDQPLNVEGILAGTHASPIAWMTAVKDRIRWLSRSLDRAEQERSTLAARLAELEGQEPVVFIKKSELDGIAGDSFLAQVRGLPDDWHQYPLFVRPVPGKSVLLTDEQIDSVHTDCETSYIPGSIVAFETFFAWGVQDAVLRANGLNDRPAGG